MTMTTTKKTLTGTLVAVMMSWMTLHTQLVLRQMTQNFLNSLMAIWEMLVRPHLMCMLRHVSSLVLRCPRKVRLRLVQLVVDHITLLVSISACCVDKWDIVLQHVPTKGNLESVHLVPMLWVVQFSLPSVMVQLSQKSDKIKTRRPLKILLRFQSRVWRGSHECPTSCRSMIETTNVGFTFAGGETAAANTKICIPHAECPQGISVNAVSNESTPFLIGLDVLREYGLVIDYHYNRLYSHILRRYLPCAILPTRHLALEMLPSNSE